MKKLFRIILVCLLLVLMLIYADATSNAILEGLRLCGSAVIPALFPLFVCSKILIGLLRQIRLPKFIQKLWQKLFGLSGQCFFAFLFGILGGYPLGAAVTAELYESKIISKTDAEKCLCFCNNSGPGFFAAAVGAKVLGSVKAGILLYVIHVFSALYIGILQKSSYKSYAPAINHRQADRDFGAIFLDGINETCNAMLRICGLILFFSVLGNLAECIGFYQLLDYLQNLLPATELRALLQGILELTSGIMLLKDHPHSFVIAAFLMGWGGFCVHFQAKAFWSKQSLIPSHYYSTKLFHGLFSAVLAWAIAYLTLAYLLILGMILAILPLLRRKFRKHTGNFSEYAL